MLRAVLIAATVFVVGCPSAIRPTPPHGSTVDLTALEIRVARAEVKRADGLSELVELATHGEPVTRARALRGLGRIGGPKALEVIEAAIDDASPQVVDAALAALGIAASLDDLPPAKSLQKMLSMIAHSHARPYGAGSVDPKPDPTLVEVLVEAVGRAGGPDEQHDLAMMLPSAPPELAAHIALALGRHGRRKLPLKEAARAALVLSTHHRELAVRYAAVYALSREFRAKDAPADREVEGALAARVTDGDPEVRATAIAALARRNAIGAARKDIEDSLHDRDWRVAVEAVRALAGDHGDAAGRAAVASVLPQRWKELEHGNEAEAQVITEALRALLKVPLEVTLVPGVTNVSGAAASGGSLARGWISCLSQMALAHRSGNGDPLPRCEHDGLDAHLRLPLLAELINAGAGTVTTRRDALRTLLETSDARVRAAGIGALAAIWKDGNANDHHTIVATVASAIASSDPIIAGSAIDVAPAIYDLLGDDPEHGVLDAAIVARAATEHDPELGASLFELIGTRTIAAGANACRGALAAPPVRARAAATCLKQLGEPAPAPAIVAESPPPVDVADVIGKHLWWRVVTTRGELVIYLRPEVAPWNVATIVALTRRGFFDGLEFHRVVADFVAQGGDPTMSGWGGPGFTTPAEPGTRLDGDGFTTGAIGIADSGRDTGGSQWFVMHSHAPHLDGRYTWIGNVVSGQKYADALLIGDKILHATIEELPNGTMPAGVTPDPVR